MEKRIEEGSEKGGVDITIDRNGSYEKYQETPLEGYSPMGTIKRGSKRGALYFNNNSRRYVMVRHGEIYWLDQRRIKTLMGKPSSSGRPSSGRRATVRRAYLYEGELEIAMALGDGNVSAGIRKALRLSEQAKAKGDADRERPDTDSKSS